MPKNKSHGVRVTILTVPRTKYSSGKLRHIVKNRPYYAYPYNAQLIFSEFYRGIHIAIRLTRPPLKEYIKAVKLVNIKEASIILVTTTVKDV
jgi:hypothetical protein